MQHLSVHQTAVLLGCAVIAGLVAACSSVKTYVDKAPIKARTFSFLNTGSKPVPTYAEESTKAHAMVQEAVTKNLGSKGVQYVASGGDVLVGYLIVVGNNTTTTSLNTYFGYTDESDAFLNKVHSTQTGGGARNYFEAGTLVLDFIDAAGTKLLQRRTIQGQVFRNLPMETRTARLQSVVDEALKNLPLSH